MSHKVFASREAFLKENTALNTDLPWEEDLSCFRQPLTVGPVTIPNRLVCQPMEGCDGTPEGSPGELTVRRYDRLARGGAGLIWFEATAVLPEARANPRQLSIREDNLDDFRRETDRIRETGLRENGYAPVIVMQATHSGRYSRPQGVPAPLIACNSPILERNAPISADRIVTDAYLDSVRDALVRGAELAQKAGFDGVDIKCCHRYLNCELLSAYTRPGRYGGSLENRTRLLREAVSGAMERCGSGFLVTSRLNLYDGYPRPWGFGVPDDGSIVFDPEEPVWLLRQLAALGVPLLNITMGNPYFNPHVNRPFARGGYTSPEHPLEGVARMLKGTAQVRQQVPEIKLICSGLSYLGIAAPHVAAAFLREGGFDLAGFGRTILAYPDFAKDILSGQGMNPKKLCVCCSRCTEIMRCPGGTPGCAVRDRELYGKIYEEQCGGKNNG